MSDRVRFLKQALEGCPPASAPTPELRGWNIDGVFFCAGCISRLVARGVMFAPAIPVWADDPDEGARCHGCER